MCAFPVLYLYLVGAKWATASTAFIGGQCFEFLTHTHRHYYYGRLVVWLFFVYGATGIDGAHYLLGLWQGANFEHTGESKEGSISA